MARWLILLLAAACGGSDCDPCPGAVKVEETTIRVQLGLQPVLQCTPPHGWVLTIPMYAVCNPEFPEYPKKWEEMIHGT